MSDAGMMIDRMTIGRMTRDRSADAPMPVGRTRSRKVDRAVFKLLVAGTYPLFLVGVAVSRALRLGAGEGSIFAQALRTDEATIAIAFTG